MAFDQAGILHGVEHLFQKAERRIEGLHGETEHAQHFADGVADGFLVVDDEDGRGHCKTIKCAIIRDVFRAGA